MLLTAFTLASFFFACSVFGIRALHLPLLVARSENELRGLLLLQLVFSPPLLCPPGLYPARFMLGFVGRVSVTLRTLQPHLSPTLVEDSVSVFALTMCPAHLCKSCLISLSGSIPFLFFVTFSFFVSLSSHHYSEVVSSHFQNLVVSAMHGSCSNNVSLSCRAFVGLHAGVQHIKLDPTDRFFQCFHSQIQGWSGACHVLYVACACCIWC